MGLLDQLGGMLNDKGGAGGGGGGQPDLGALLGRLRGGNANLNDHSSEDAQHFGRMVQGAGHDDLASTFGHAARQVDEHEYREHITPGAGGTDPLGGLGGGALGTLASSLLGNLARGKAGGSAGGGGAAGGGLGSLLGQIPGLGSTDPNRMSKHDVATLADWTRRNDPDAFGRSAAEVGQKDPSVLQSLLGNKAMMSAAAGLAMKFLSQRKG